MSGTKESTRTSEVGQALERLERAWERSDAILGMVRRTSLDRRPIDQRHPLLFYVGHLPAFARNMLVTGVLGKEPFAPGFDSFFDFGIDPEEGEAETRETWPALDRVLRYRDRVRAEVREAALELEAVGRDDVLARNGRILHLVGEHEEMHHETLLYMLQELGTEHMQRPSWWRAPVPGEAAGPEDTVRVPGGEIELGADFDELAFGWDNEFPARTVHVDSFELDRLPVTLVRYLEFVEAGGYGRRELWDEEGWRWIEKHGIGCPKDWTRRSGTWFVRTMFEHVPLAEVAGWPACVSLCEAKAYARWKGRRLPTEAELSRAAFGAPDGDDRRAYPWGDAPPSARRGNFGFHHTGPLPVGSHPEGSSAFGVLELVGNGWDWTETPFAAHEGFEPYVEGYRGYSRDFFDGKHYVIFGGSWATSEGLLRRTFRNWYRFNYPYPFTKFRLAGSA